MRAARSVAALLVAALLAGCGPEPVSPPPKPVAKPRPSARPRPPEPTSSVLAAFPSPAGEPPYKVVVSKRLQLGIRLPNRSGWELRREKSTFLIMDHAGTASHLLVGLWQEDQRMTPKLCEERGRLLRDLPRRGDGLLKSSTLEVPAGFDTPVDVGFAAAGQQGGPVSGWLLGFGARVRRCFAFVFTTEASGEQAEQVVGDRLAIMQTLALEGIELRSDIDVAPER